MSVFRVSAVPDRAIWTLILAFVPARGAELECAVRYLRLFGPRESIGLGREGTPIFPLAS